MVMDLAFASRRAQLVEQGVHAAAVLEHPDELGRTPPPAGRRGRVRIRLLYEAI